MAPFPAQEDVFSALGWRVLAGPPIAKTLAQEAGVRVIEARDATRWMLLPFPELSHAEAALLLSMQRRFQQSQQNGTKNADAAALDAFIQSYCTEQGIELEAEQGAYLRTALERSVTGYWPLDPLLSCARIEEISVVGIGRKNPVRVFDVAFGWIDVNVCLESAVFFRHLVNRMAQSVGKRLSLKTPRLNAVLESGSRLHAAIEPVAFGSVTLSIRKFREAPFSPLDLVRLRTLDAQVAAFLWMALETDCSALVCGNTGSGKTSTLNALFCFVPRDERIVSVEETPELRLLHRHWVRLSTFEESGIAMDSLIRDSLRMRPDRVVVGEMRSGAEVAAFVDTLLAGQGKGSLATFHAQSAREALNRFRTLGVFAIDLCALDLIVVQKRVSRVEPKTNMRFEERRVTEVCEVAEETDALAFRRLFSFDFASGQWNAMERSVRVMEKACRTFGLDAEGFGRELARRARLLERAAASGKSYAEWFVCMEQELASFERE
jgi:Flp pilus assembly CpaF family ATPase